MEAAPEIEVDVPDPVMPRVPAVRPLVMDVDVPAPVAVSVVKVPAAAVEPPITTLSKVEVETERPVAVPALEISHVLEFTVTASPPSPKVMAPLKAAVEETVSVVNVPAAAVEPPITTLSKVEVETESPVAVPAEEMSQVLEFTVMASPPSPKMRLPVNVWLAFSRTTLVERAASWIEVAGRTTPPPETVRPPVD